MQLKETRHGRDEDMGEVVGDRRSEVLELIRSSIDSRDIGGEREKRR